MTYSELGSDWRAGIVASITSTALLTAILAPFRSEGAFLNEGLLFLLLTLSVSSVWGVRVGIFAAALTNVVLNFFFISPLHRLSVHDPANVVGLAVFLAVSLISGSLVSAARLAAERARRGQAESAVLLELSRALIGQIEPQAALAALCEHVVTTFKAPGAAVLSPVGSVWSVLARAGDESVAGRLPDAEERSVADRVLASGQPEALGYSGLGQRRQPRIVQPAARSGWPIRALSATFIQLRLAERPMGVLRLDGPLGDTVFLKEPESVLTAFAQEAALAVQRFELAQAAAQADLWRQADEMKTTLMASISHDLKTPLAAIKTSVSGLLDSSVHWTDEDQHAFLETVESQADRLDRLISDILDLNRIESGTIVGEKKDVFVLDLLEEAKEAATAATRDCPVLISTDESYVVVTDRTLVRQALVNLLENAAKYGTMGSPIHLEARPAGDKIEIAVTDQGRGISAADQLHVFDSFYRGARDQGRINGTGLGLTIVKGFVELSGGDVRVVSSEAGSSFIISLPRKLTPEPVTT